MPIIFITRETVRSKMGDRSPAPLPTPGGARTAQLTLPCLCAPLALPRTAVSAAPCRTRGR